MSAPARNTTMSAPAQKATTSGGYTSQGIDRLDARHKVTGKAVYAAEVAVANLAHAVIVGSTVARGAIKSLDVRAARQAPGVLAVLTHENAPRLPGARPAKKGDPSDRVLQLLQDDQVLFDDQPVAVVVADTLDRARFAARLVTVTYDHVATPAVTFDLRSPNYAPPKANRDPADSSRGDAARARGAAPAVVDATYTIPAENHNPMEMHGTIAVWRATRRWCRASPSGCDSRRGWCTWRRLRRVQRRGHERRRRGSSRPGRDWPWAARSSASPDRR